MPAKTPEPVELVPGRLPEIPDPPKRGAVRNLQKSLLGLATAEGDRGLSEEAAEAIAYAVADPSETRSYALKHLSYMKVPGGTFTLIRDRLLVNRVITYPVNPRVLDSQRFPAASSDGAQRRLFWPERDVVGDPDGNCELLLRGEDRTRVSAVLQDHARRLRQQNKLDTIPELGVLRPIIVMPMTVRTGDDDKDPVVALTSVEGSSRTAWSHLAQGIDAAAPLYGATSDPAAAQAVARELAQVAVAPANTVSAKDLGRVRTLLIPAEIIVGFTPEPATGSPRLDAVVDQLLGLTHIDPPKPWSGQATEAKIGEKILASLQDEGHIDADEHAWLAGMISPEEAEAKGLDPWSARRAARLLWLVSRDTKESISKAVADGVRSASFQRRVKREAKGDSVAALALRAFDPEKSDDDRAVRAAMPRAMRTPAFYVTGKAGNGRWSVTERDPDELRDAALKEMAQGKKGPATLELAALAMWPLVTSGDLRRGKAKSRTDGDPRDPEQILDGLMSSERGIRVLHRAAADDLDGLRPRQIDMDTFGPVPTVEGGWVAANENWLRKTVVPKPEDKAAAGDAHDEAATVTPIRRFEERLEIVDNHMARIPVLLDEVEEIKEDDGTAVVKNEGIDDAHANTWNNILLGAMTKIRGHADTHNKRYGSLAEPEDDDSDLSSRD